MSEEDIKRIEECGEVAFDYKQVALLVSLDENEVRQQFESERGDIYEAWMRGRLRTELEVRRQMIKTAKTTEPGAGKMTEALADLFRRTDDIHRDLRE